MKKVVAFTIEVEKASMLSGGAAAMVSAVLAEKFPGFRPFTSPKCLEIGPITDLGDKVRLPLKVEVYITPKVPRHPEMENFEPKVG